MNRCFLSLIIFGILTVTASAEPKGPELMDLLGDDPSLLLEPADSDPPERNLSAAPETPPPAVTDLLPPVPAPAPVPSPVIVPVAEPVVAAPVVVEPVVVRPQPQPPTAKPTSELTVLSGVNDISIIFSNKEFFPAQVKMKKTEKTRLIFTTTDKKPAALVFEKQKLTRWIASESVTSNPEYRELNPTRISEIHFDAEPGVYRFYDAISGASGEIQVE